MRLFKKLLSLISRVVFAAHCSFGGGGLLLLSLIMLSFLAASYFFITERQAWRVSDDTQKQTWSVADFSNPINVACLPPVDEKCSHYIHARIELVINEENWNLSSNIRLLGIGNLQLNRQEGDAIVLYTESRIPSRHSKSLFPSITSTLDNPQELDEVQSNLLLQTQIKEWKATNYFMVEGEDAWWWRPFGAYRFSGNLAIGAGWVKESRDSALRLGLPIISVRKGVAQISEATVIAPAGFQIVPLEQSAGRVLAFKVTRSNAVLAFSVFLMLLVWLPVYGSIVRHAHDGSGIDLLSTLFAIGSVRALIAGPKLLPAAVDIYFGIVLIAFSIVFLKQRSAMRMAKRGSG